MFDARNNYQLIFISREQFHNIHSNNSTRFSTRDKKNEEKFTRNFTIFTVTVPLVLPTDAKDSEKFTKFHSSHSFSSTNPSHKVEGFDNEIFKISSKFTVSDFTFSPW